MNIELEAMVRRERCRDLLREAEWERGIRRVLRTEQDASFWTRVRKWIRCAAKSFRASRRYPQPVVRTKETAAF